MKPDLNLSHVQEFLLNLLPRAGQILRRFFHSEKLSKKLKSPLDFVTEADLAVDKYLKKELATEFKNIPILSEETSAKNFHTGCVEHTPGVVLFNNKLKNEKLLFIIDPLDGTTNFSRGNDNFSISCALVSNGKPLVGVIFAPVNSRLFWAREDKDGAYWNGRRINVSSIANLNEAVVCTDWSHILNTRDQTTDFLKKVFHRVRQIKILGSAATDITFLARGGVDIYHHVHLYPWDIAASSLIAAKAGAKITDSRGDAWDVFTPSILAANPTLHRKILEILI